MKIIENVNVIINTNQPFLKSSVNIPDVNIKAKVQVPTVEYENDYNKLSNIPTINDVEVKGNKNIENFDVHTSQLINNGDGSSPFATEDYVEQNGGKIDKILLNNEEQAIIDKAVNLTINKTTVGLSNVDNTSDANKPVSIAQANAINQVQSNLDEHISNYENPHNVTKEQIGLGNVDNTSDLNKPISTQTQTALDGLNQTITNNFNNLNSSIENETERATLAETEISTKLQQEMNTRVQEHSEIQGKIDTINSKIPNQASSTNQLADKAFVNSTINSSAAFFKGSFESKAALDAVQWQTTDSSLATYVSNNDYAYVEADETHNNEAWRYIYVKDNTVSEWQPQFRVNESPFTQAQLDAINSGATADLINSINSKLTQDAIVDNTGDSSIKAISQRAATLGINAVQNNLNTHISNTQNPHNVTKTQVGLSNVDNTSDIDKPISTAVQSALDLMLPRSEAPTKVSDLENDAAYIKNNDLHGCVQIPYIYNVQRIYSAEDKDHLYGNPNGQTHIALSSDHVSIDRQYPNTPTYIRVFASERDGVQDVTSIQSASTKRLIINGVEEPTFPSNTGGLHVISEDDGSYIKADLSKLTAVQNEDGSNTLHQDSKSLIFNWNGLYLNNNEISPNSIRYDIEQTLTDEQKAQARANIGAGTGGGTVISVAGEEKTSINTDTTPTANSQNLVTSGGVHDYPAITFAESERQKSKNLFPYSTITGTDFYQQHLNTPIKAGTYTISALVSSSDTDSDLSSIVFEDEDKIYPKTINLSRNNRSSTTFTINHDCSYVTFFASYSYAVSVGDTFTFSDIQIEEGSVATDYQPYNGAIVHEKEIGITIGNASFTNVVTGGEVSWVKQGKLVVVSFSDIKFKSPIAHQNVYFFGLPKKAIKAQTFLLHQMNAHGGSSLRCMMQKDSTQIINWYQDTDLDTNAQYYGQLTYITDEN